MNKMGIIRQNYELTCIGPVHTGSGEMFKAFEYLYNSVTHVAAFLNQTKWIAFLDRHGRIDAFADYVEKRASGLNNLRTWLLAQGVSETELDSLAVRRAKADPLTDGEKDTLNDVICQTTLANGQPYIPGSTIKGALRTGILHHRICREPQKYRRVWEDCRAVLRSDDRLGKKKRELSNIIGQLEMRLLHTLSKEEKTPQRNATVSAMRGLRVSDAVCAEGEMDTVILRKLDATTGMEDGPGESKVSLFRECIPAGRRLTFSITADLAMLHTLGIHSLDEIIAIVRAYTAEGLQIQEKVFGRDYAARFAEAKNADALLGGGTGFLAKTLVYTLAPVHEAREFLAAFFDEEFTAWDPTIRGRGPAHKHRQYDRAISPRTLKLARMDTQDWLMGLCSITGVGNAQTV